MSDWKRMTEGISVTIELTKDSSQELMRILEEQDAKFINELLEGKGNSEKNHSLDADAGTIQGGLTNEREDNSNTSGGSRATIRRIRS